MKKQNVFTLLEIIVIAFILMMLLAIFMPSLGKVKKIGQRVICGTNLKGAGIAMKVYTNDNDGFFPQFPGKGSWSKELGFDYDNAAPDLARNTSRTITASWYLLVRQADTAPKSFVCPESNQVEFGGQNPKNLDITELWDFGSDPYKHVSYAMHNPYGKFPAHQKLPAAFAVAADMSPWFKDGNILPKGENANPPQILDLLDKNNWVKAISQNHNTKGELLSGRYRPPGQNVLYADGHLSYEKTSNVGVNQDNIYTYWSKDKEPSQQDIQGGTAPTNRDPENDAKNENDSFLAI